MCVVDQTLDGLTVIETHTHPQALSCGQVIVKAKIPPLNLAREVMDEEDSLHVLQRHVFGYAGAHPRQANALPPLVVVGECAVCSPLRLIRIALDGAVAPLNDDP